ncbi:hypothetical protein NDU88_006533 [Pleurodeles waltl]|uniref:Uncharacterized protein n=1 Tax=Pleurodeles waltl TaxID=8319 RepID=A0AAV7UN15_PLEWA|nr:hypothetical protein NDU88_006533 [Pleurodeles waltl]
MAHRPDLTSPAQHRESSKITFRGQSVCTTLSAPRPGSQPPPQTVVRSPRPLVGLQASQIFKHPGVPPGSQATGSPPSTRSLRHTDLAPNHQGKEALPGDNASRWPPEGPLNLQAPPLPGTGPRSSHHVSRAPGRPLGPQSSVPRPQGAPRGKARPAAQAAHRTAQRAHPYC